MEVGQLDLLVCDVLSLLVLVAAAVNSNALVLVAYGISSNIALYPNPARTTVTISGLESGSTVTVVDLNGRVVLTSTDATLDVSDLAQGAYFVRIVGERQNAIRKLIVK